MKRKQRQTWLFAFTDLAFLLLISLSLIPSAPDSIVIHFSEMDVPDVPNNSNLSPVPDSTPSWELQVLEKTEKNNNPFRLVKIAVRTKNNADPYEISIDRDHLIPELMALKENSIRPLLLPEKKSLSNDFLYAAGAIAKVWSVPKSQAVVKPIISEKPLPE